MGVLLTQLETQAGTIEATDERYLYIVDQSFPEALHTELVAMARATLEGEAPAVPTSLATMVELTGGDSYAELHDHVLLAITSDTVDRRVDETNAAEDSVAPWRLAWLVTAGLTGLSLLALVIMGFNPRRPRPPRNEPHDDLAALVIPPYRPPSS